MQRINRSSKHPRTRRFTIGALVYTGALAAACSVENEVGPPTAADTSQADGSPGVKSANTGNTAAQRGGQAGNGAAQISVQSTPRGSSGSGGAAGASAAQTAPSTRTDASEPGAAGTRATEGSKPEGAATAGAGSVVEAECGEGDTPETGLQGDKYPSTVNCGLTLLADVPNGGSVQGSGHCAYMRSGSSIQAFSLADPLNPVKTDEEPTSGSTESMRAQTVDGRAVLVSGSVVYDISNCEDMVKKGEIKWPSSNYQGGLTVAAISGHEIAISHDAKRVYSGLGFAVVNIEDLDHPDTWTVKNWTCEMNEQCGYSGTTLADCEGPTQDDFTIGHQYSHSSDDNLEGTVWYGATQLDVTGGSEPSTARMVDISQPGQIKVLDMVRNVPGHSMNWWRTPTERDFIIAANEGFGSADSCIDYPRPTELGNDLDLYIVEVSGNKFGTPFPLTLDINKPENCQAAKSSGARASITEHTVYNKNGAAFVMVEFGGAGLRVFDLRDGEHPKEAAYYNDGKGHAHSGVFHYDDARGIMLASGSQAMHVLMLEPQMIEALGLPKPTDPAYPYK